MPQGRATDRPLEDCRVALTGRFSSLTHEEMAQLLSDLGGRLDRFPTRYTTILVVGGGQLPLDERARPTRAFEKARKLKVAGYPIEIITEQDFWVRFCLETTDDHVKRLYTVGQLTRLLDVKRDQLRSWMHAGLISPVEIRHRLPFFDYGEVQSMKRLCDLAKRGISTARIRASLEQLRRWLPDVGTSLAQLTLLEESGQLLVRGENDRLMEPSGQLRLDFDQDGGPESLPWPGAETPEELFEHALELDDGGQWAEAEALYRRLVELDPRDPVYRFNLANVEFAQGRAEDAAADYLAVTQLDPEYVEAWSGLGCVLSNLGRCKEAVVAFRRAVQIEPTYGDAHFNLADELERAGDIEEACQHWRRYLQLDKTSGWADAARERLAMHEPERKARIPS